MDSVVAVSSSSAGAASFGAGPAGTDARALRRWRNSSASIYVVTGLAFASWATRTPEVQASMGLSTQQMGFVLFALSAGALVGLLFSAPLVARFGGRAVLATGSTFTTAGVGIAGLGELTGVSPVVIIGLAAMGMGFGVGEVALNIEGAALERITGRSVLPLLHGSFSAGSLAGSAIGALAEALRIPVGIHFTVVGFVLIPVCLTASRFIPAGTGKERHEGHSRAERLRVTLDRLSVWREPRTILIGVIVLCMAFAEGAATDWLPIAMVHGHNTDPAIASLAFTVFVAAMTAGRLSGSWLVDRFGRVPILRVASALAVIGVVTVVFGTQLTVIMIGAAVWGLGAALGFPLGLSAAADNPNNTAARVGAVATLGYIAFLVGPPALGSLGQAIGILPALLSIAGIAVVCGIVAGSARPLAAVPVESRPSAGH